MRGLLFIVIIVPLDRFVKGCTQSTEKRLPGREEARVLLYREPGGVDFAITLTTYHPVYCDTQRTIDIVYGYMQCLISIILRL